MSKYLTHTACDWRKVPKRDYKGSDNIEFHVQTYITQLKYDGVCALMIVDGDSTYFLSRTGEEITSVGHISEAFSSLPFSTCCGILADQLGQSDVQEELPEQRRSGVYFGELWHPTMDQPSISGASRRKVADDDSKQLQFVVFDYVTLDEYAAGESGLGWEKRIDRVLWMTTLFHPDDYGKGASPEGRKAPPFWLASNEGMVYEQQARSLLTLAQEAKAAGNYDGIILRDPLGPWRKGARNGAVIKVKPDITVDVRVVDVVEGKGKYVGMLGALVCEYNGKTFQLSGMSDSLRLQWWNCPDLIIGQIVEVEAMEISKHGVLREPRFKSVRFDTVREEDK